MAKTSKKQWKFTDDEQIRCGNDTCPIAALAGIRGSGLWVDPKDEVLKPQVKRLGLSPQQVDRIIDATDNSWDGGDLRGDIIKALGLDK